MCVWGPYSQARNLSTIGHNSKRKQIEWTACERYRTNQLYLEEPTNWYVQETLRIVYGAPNQAHTSAECTAQEDPAKASLYKESGRYENIDLKILIGGIEQWATWARSLEPILGTIFAYE